MVGTFADEGGSAGHFAGGGGGDNGFAEKSGSAAAACGGIGVFAGIATIAGDTARLFIRREQEGSEGCFAVRAELSRVGDGPGENTRRAESGN